MHSLNVYLNTQYIATLTIEGKEDIYTFTYSEDWAKHGYEISPHLPFHEVISSASIKRFLDNLLPEGKGLDDLTSFSHISKNNIFGLIQAIGFETSGALHFGHHKNDNVSNFRPITQKELIARIDEIESKSIIIWDKKPRLSLAGVQEKLPVLLKDGVLGLADGSLSSTHILKFQTKKNTHIVITNKVMITKEMMQEATQLKLICIAATGMNNVDLQAAADLGIAVKNVSGYSTPSVVQHTFTMALHLIGKMRHYGSYATSGAWTNSQLFTDVSHPFYEISGKKWGIIGLGEIGKEVAKVATAFGAEVSYYSTSQKNLEQDYPHRLLESLLEESDIISIHAPLNAQTKNLLNKKNLHLLKDKAILLNLGRGGIVNETDIATLIDEKEIYVGLDVTETEPIALDNPLLKYTIMNVY